MAKKLAFEARDILEALVEGWGGLPKWIADVRKEIAGLPPGHANRIKFHLAIFQELMKLGASGGEEQTLEEKQAELQELVAELGGVLPDEDEDE